MKVGVITSGGDCPGLNTLLRSITNQAELYGWELFAIKRGASGLLKRPVDAFRLTLEYFENAYLSKAGGTFIGGMNKGGPLPNEKDKIDTISEGYYTLKLDAMICIGGDGSLQILNEIAKTANLNIVGVPKTIDNDLGETDKSIGFDTAVDIATDAIDKLQTTAASHDRFMVLEVMGRDAGHIALHAGVAGEADIILIPEINYSLDGIKNKIESVLKSGRKYGTVVVSESVKKENGESLTQDFSNGQIRYGGIAHYIAEQINKITGVETRHMSLGHLQRGAMPSASDRIIANAFGVKACKMIQNKEFGHMAAWKNNEMISVPMEKAIENYKLVTKNDLTFKTATNMGIYIGEIT